jgi:hypothetical protein
MKKYFSIIRIFIITLVIFLTGCVHDDEYSVPDLNGSQCQDEAYFTDSNNKFVKWSISDLKGKTQNQPFTDNAYVEGYVSSTDESGNIYKYLYIQDSPTNPTQGLVVSANAVSMYAKYPQGYKVYIKLKGLAIGMYGGIKQLGYYGINPDTNTLAFGRIPEKLVFSSIVRSCTEKATIVPKELTLTQIRSAADQNQYMGCLIKVPNAEFDAKVLCSIYAPENFTVDRTLNDATYTNPSTATVVVRNSGFASFANQKLPSGKGDFIGILSKYGSTFQLYINKASDLSGMKNFPRKDGVTSDPCSIDATATAKTVAEVKQLYISNTKFNQITDNFYVKAKVTTSDETGNLYKYLYVEDATGGIRVNINKLNLYQDARFKVGKNVIINLKNLYIGKYNGEFQLGQPNGLEIGQVAEADVYKFFYDSNEPVTTVTATEKTIANLTTDDVGKWIKIKGLQFIDSDLSKTYVSGSAATNRTLEDCSGNKIILRTSNFASFATAQVDEGKGDVYAILSIFNGTYQLWIPKQVNADLDGARCDGTVPSEIIYWDAFDIGLRNWTTVNVTGDQVWTISTTSGNNYAKMTGYSSGNFANEDWLISPEINLNGYKSAYVNLDSDYNFTGDRLETYITTNYTGDVKTTTWTALNIPLDQASGWGFYNSGNVSLNNYIGQKVRIAFKYKSTTSSASTWEIDNFKVKGTK